MIEAKINNLEAEIALSKFIKARGERIYTLEELLEFHSLLWKRDNTATFVHCLNHQEFCTNNVGVSNAEERALLSKFVEATKKASLTQSAMCYILEIKEELDDANLKIKDELDKVNYKIRQAQDFVYNSLLLKNDVSKL